MSAPIVTVWTYSDWTYEGVERVPVERRDDWRFSGVSPADTGHFVRAIGEVGYAVTTAGQPPVNHHTIGCGVGHDDAKFAETGISMAAYYESGEAFGGHWWDDPFVGPKYYGIGAEPCEWCATADGTVYRAADGDDAVCADCRESALT